MFDIDILYLYDFGDLPANLPSVANLDYWFSNVRPKMANYLGPRNGGEVPRLPTATDWNQLSNAQKYKVLCVYSKAADRGNLLEMWRATNPFASQEQLATTIAEIQGGGAPSTTSHSISTNSTVEELDWWYTRQSQAIQDTMNWTRATQAQKYAMFRKEQVAHFRYARFQVWLARHPGASAQRIANMRNAITVHGMGPVEAEPSTSRFDGGDASTWPEIRDADMSVVDELAPEAGLLREGTADLDVAGSLIQVYDGNAAEVQRQILAMYQGLTDGSGGAGAAASAATVAEEVGSTVAAGAVAGEGAADAVGSIARIVGAGLGILATVGAIVEVVNFVGLAYLPVDIALHQIENLATDARTPHDVDAYVQTAQDWVPDLHADVRRQHDELPIPGPAPNPITCGLGCQIAKANEVLPTASSEPSMFMAMMGAMSPGSTYNCTAHASAQAPVDANGEPVLVNGLQPQPSGVPVQNALQRDLAALLAQCVAAPSGALVTTQSPSDPVFRLQVQGSTKTHISASLPVADWSGAPVSTRVSGHWFVQSSLGTKGQTLRLPYIDWDGKDRIAFLQKVGGLDTFVTMPGDVASNGQGVAQCISSGACKASASLELRAPDGLRYTARLDRPYGPTIGAVRVSANPTEGKPATITVSTPDDNAGPVAYSYAFPAGRGSTTTTSFAIPIADGEPTKVASVLHTFSKAGPAWVTVTLTDGRGVSTKETVPVNVADVAPTVSVTGVASNNGVVSLTGQVVDPGVDDPITLTVRWCDRTTSTAAHTMTGDSGAGVFTAAGTGSQRFTVTHADDPQTTACVIAVEVSDGYGGKASTSVGAPAAPSPVSVVVADRTATLHFGAGTPVNGAPITAYQLTSWDKTANAAGPTLTQVVQPKVPAAAIVVPGLTIGHTYTFGVSARNVLGISTPAPSGAVTIGAPSAPTALTESGACFNVPGPWGAAPVRACSATLTFAAGADNGAAITGYTLTLVDLSTTTPGLLPGMPPTPAPVVTSRRLTDVEVRTHTVVLHDLIGGHLYGFSFTASNGRGVGQPSTTPRFTAPT
jgi:hypothetical protein